MKVLLDENLDRALRSLLGHHDVVTAAYMGWAGLQNGKLLRAAENHGIHVLLTGDQTLISEQNLAGMKIAVVAVSRIELPILTGYLPEITAAIEAATPGSYRLVDCGSFSRKRNRSDESPTR